MDNKIFYYFDSIEPSGELIERTVNMAQNNNKKITLSKGAIAVLVAAIVLVIGVTGYAAAAHIFGNNEKGIVQESNNDGVRFTLDFTKADVTPNVYSNLENPIIKQFTKAGYTNVLLPDALINASFTVGDIYYNEGRLNAISFDDNQGHIFNLYIFPKLATEDMKDAVALEGSEELETNECYVKTYNGIDVQLSYFGSREFGYSSRITYAVDDTLYIIAPPNSDTLEQIKNRTQELALTLETQH